LTIKSVNAPVVYRSGRCPFKAERGVRLPFGVPFNAGVAQLVEHYLAKVNVVGSNPIARSNFLKEETIMGDDGKSGKRLGP